jgi:hypothetical protein
MLAVLRAVLMGSSASAADTPPSIEGPAAVFWATGIKDPSITGVGIGIYSQPCATNEMSSKKRRVLSMTEHLMRTRTDT